MPARIPRGSDPGTRGARRLIVHERWLRANRPDSVVARWLMHEPAQFLTNGPVLRLPKELKTDRATRLLQIGAGAGALLQSIDRQVRLDRSLVGVEFSAAALRARRPSGSRPALLQGNPFELPLAPDSFTLVLCGYVARHLDDEELRALFAEIYRVLAPGGLAVIWDFGPSGNRLLDAWNARVLAHGERPRLRSTATLRRHARLAGFPFTRPAELRPFLVPPIARASLLVGRPPEGWEGPLE